MKGGAALATIALILLGLAFVGASNSTRSISVPTWWGEENEEHRASLVEFAATHDWETELEARAIAPRRGVLDQMLAPLRDREADVDVRLGYSMRISERGVYAFAPSFREIDVASDYIRARLELESLLIAAAADASIEAEKRSGLVWRAYGSGFDARVREFLAERVAVEPDPVLRAFEEELLARLGGPAPDGD